MYPGFNGKFLPLLAAVIQPDQKVDDNFSEYHLTINQGIHGAQDNCNAILRMGIPYHIIVENRKSDRFKKEWKIWAYAAMTAEAMKQMKVGLSADG